MGLAPLNVRRGVAESMIEGSLWSSWSLARICVMWMVSKSLPLASRLEEGREAFVSCIAFMFALMSILG